MKAPTCNSGCAYPIAILVTGATCSSWVLAATKSQLRKILAESARPSRLVAKPFATTDSWPILASATSNLVCVGRVSQICLVPIAWWPQPFGKCCCWAAGAICNARFLASAKQLQPDMNDESTNLQQWLRLPNCNPGDRSHLQQLGQAICHNRFLASATSNLVCVGRVSQICLIPTAWWPQPFGKCCSWAAGAICNARFLASARQLQPDMNDESTNLQQWLRLPNSNPGDRSHLQQLGVGRNQVPA